MNEFYHNFNIRSTYLYMDVYRNTLGKYASFLAFLVGIFNRKLNRGLYWWAWHGILKIRGKINKTKEKGHVIWWNITWYHATIQRAENIQKICRVNLYVMIWLNLSIIKGSKWSPLVNYRTIIILAYLDVWMHWEQFLNYFFIYQCLLINNIFDTWIRGGRNFPLIIKFISKSTKCYHVNTSIRNINCFDEWLTVQEISILL